MLTVKCLQPFLIHFFTCKVDICLTKTFLGMPWIFVWFPWISVHNIDLFRQSCMKWCCSNHSMLISTSYDPKGKIFKSILAGKPFKFTSHSLTSSKTFLFVPVANCTHDGLSCFTLSSLHVSTILGDTQLQQAPRSITIKIEVFETLPSISTIVAWWLACRPSSAA